MYSFEIKVLSKLFFKWSSNIFFILNLKIASPFKMIKLLDKILFFILNILLPISVLMPVLMNSKFELKYLFFFIYFLISFPLKPSGKIKWLNLFFFKFLIMYQIIGLPWTVSNVFGTFFPKLPNLVPFQPHKIIAVR